MALATMVGTHIEVVVSQIEVVTALRDGHRDRTSSHGISPGTEQLFGDPDTLQAAIDECEGNFASMKSSQESLLLTHTTSPKPRRAVPALNLGGSSSCVTAAGLSVGEAGTHSLDNDDPELQQGSLTERMKEESLTPQEMARHDMATWIARAETRAGA